MRISDWSSDVCSSDLIAQVDALERRPARPAIGTCATSANRRVVLGRTRVLYVRVVMATKRTAHQHPPLRSGTRPGQNGRASCRERVCKYGEISVVAVELKKHKHTIPVYKDIKK